MTFFLTIIDTDVDKGGQRVDSLCLKLRFKTMDEWTASASSSAAWLINLANMVRVLGQPGLRHLLLWFLILRVIGTSSSCRR